MKFLLIILVFYCLIKVMALHKVFVYGTLKNGEPNHYWLTEETNGISKFIGKAKTLEKYPLIIATKYNIPMLLYSPGNGSIVEGEIYEVDEQMLLKLDELEDHPNYYVREMYNVAAEEKMNGTRIECWIYFIKDFNSKLLERPTYSSYKSLGDHNLPYMDRSLRDPIYCADWRKEFMNK